MFDYIKLKMAIYKEFYKSDKYEDIKGIFKNYDSMLNEFDFISEIHYEEDIPTNLMISSKDVDLVLSTLDASHIKENLEVFKVFNSLKSIKNEKIPLIDMVKHHFKTMNVSKAKIKKAKEKRSKIQSEHDLEIKFKKRITHFNSHIENSKVFLSIDLEFAATKRGTFITEIGYSLYDSSTQEIENNHYIIIDYLHERKYCYIPEGHIDLYSYGYSENLMLHEAKSKLKKAINKADCLVFHGSGADLKLLSDVFDSNHRKIIDTSKLAQAVFKDLNGTSLGNILKRYKIEEQPLHNAGNDAALTMLILSKLTNKKSFTPNIQEIVDHTDNENFLSDKIYKKNKLPIRRQAMYINDNRRY